MFYSGRKFSSGDKITASEMREVLEAAQKVTDVHPSGNVAVTSTVGAMTIAEGPQGQLAVRSMDNYRRSFIGRIVKKGPNDEADFQDSRYWVKEVFDFSVDVDDPLERPDFKYDLEEDSRFPQRHIMAVNVNERMADASLDTHLFDVDGFSDPNDAPTVQVFSIRGVRRRPRYYFQLGSGGSTLAFALVHNTYSGSTPFVDVRIIAWNTETQVWEFQGEPTTVWCWPPLDSSHYEALVWTSDTITPDCNPIGIRQVGGAFYAEQTLLTMPIRSPGVNYSDCRAFA